MYSISLISYLYFINIYLYQLKKCVTDDDCNTNECCTPTLNLGNRCRGHMTEGTICSSFTEVSSIFYLNLHYR